MTGEGWVPRPFMAVLTTKTDCAIKQVNTVINDGGTPTGAKP